VEFFSLGPISLALFSPVTWKRQSAPILQTTLRDGAVTPFEGRDANQKDLDRLEEQAQRKFMQCRESKSCLWDQLNPSSAAGWGLTPWGCNSSPPASRGSHQEDEARLLAEIHRREARDNNQLLNKEGSDWIHVKGKIKIKTKKICVSIIKHWKRLSRGAAESTCLGVFKVQLDKAGANWSEFSTDLLLAGGWTR